MTTRMICYWSALIMASCACIASAETSADHEKLINEKRALEFNLAKIRVKLIQNNDELRDLNDRIMKLQKQLMTLLDQQPEIQFIYNRIKKIDDEIHNLQYRSQPSDP